MRTIFVILFLILVGSVAIGVLAESKPAPDAYADAVTARPTKIENPENAIGAPDGEYANLLKGGEGYLELDMGEGEEGTGGIVLTYSSDKKGTVQVQFVSGENNVLFESEANLVKGNTTVLVNYPSTLAPYQYIRLLAPGKPYQLDAIQAETFRPDSDGDGLFNDWEDANQLNKFVATGDDGKYGDWDQDTLDNTQEHELGTHPKNADTDGDGLPDNWEQNYQLNPIKADGEGGAKGDPDQDGLENLEEYSNDTSPREEDTDDDDLNDLLEVETFHTNPTDSDSDDDNLEDGMEVVKGTDPNNPDSDGDQLPDGWEDANSLNPKDPTGLYGAEGDPDQDGVNNLGEFQHGANPKNLDTDGDGLNDLIEINAKTDPTKPDTDADGLLDKWEHDYDLNLLDKTGDNGADGDPDKDGLTNLKEQTSGANPRQPDTDGDGLPDYWEVQNCLDPLSKDGNNGPAGDPDRDGKSNFVELGLGELPTQNCVAK